MSEDEATEKLKQLLEDAQTALSESRRIIDERMKAKARRNANPPAIF